MLNLNNLTSGVYFLECKIGGDSFRKKFILVK